MLLRALVALAVLIQPTLTFAEVTSVTITSRTPLADGRAFGSAGAYEKLVGRIDFALDPADPHNRGIVDLEHAQRDADGRVHFSTDLQVLRPIDAAKGNGVLLFDVPNRGRGVLSRFNRSWPFNDATTDRELGDGLLMRDARAKDHWVYATREPPRTTDTK